MSVAFLVFLCMCPIFRKQRKHQGNTKEKELPQTILNLRELREHGRCKVFPWGKFSSLKKSVMRNIGL